MSVPLVQVMLGSGLDVQRRALAPFRHSFLRGRMLHELGAKYPLIIVNGFWITNVIPAPADLWQ